LSLASGTSKSAGAGSALIGPPREDEGEKPKIGGPTKEFEEQSVKQLTEERINSKVK
jgi:hypothetical protein